MRLLVRLAIRNVGRNFKPALLNGIGIGFAVWVLVLILSLARGIESQIVGRSVRFETGAVSVVFDKKTVGFENRLAGDRLMNRLSRLLDSLPQIESYAPRIYPEHTLLYFGEHSEVVHLIGFTKKEIPLIPQMFSLLAGSAEPGGAPHGIWVSNGLADKLGLSVGDPCTLLLQSASGVINMDEYEVSGIFRYTSQGNKADVFLDYEEARQLYHTYLPSRIVVNIPELADAEQVKMGLAEGLGYCFPDQEGEKKCGGLTISSFNDHRGMARTLSAFNRYGFLSILFFLVLISFAGIWSMQVENLHKRQREVGTLLSFGFPFGAVRAVFLYESVYISLLAFVLAGAAGIVLIEAINRCGGLYLGDAASFAFGSAIVDPVWSGGDLVAALGMAVIYPLLATFFSLAGMGRKNLVGMINGKV